MKPKWWLISGVLIFFLVGGFLVSPLFHLKEKPGLKSEPVEEEKKPNDWFYVQRAYPGKRINFAAWRQAQEQAHTMREQASRALIWHPGGPSNIGGRITSIAVHPDYPNRIYVGAADGGVWFSADGGGEWEPIFDFNTTLSIGAIAIDPNDYRTIYVGTGEANSSGDSYPGNGIYKSTNGGQTWQYVGLPESYYIGRIAINPQNSQQLFVAATGLLFGKNPERGIYRSNDGGQTWQKVLFVSDSTAGIDVVIDPQNPQNVYAAMWERIRYPYVRKAGGITSGIFKSSDGGDTWTRLTNGLPPQSPTVGRIGLTISPTNPDILYAIYADHPGYFDGIYKTTNGGLNWSRVNDGALSSIYSSFGWYFGNIYVDPTNPNTVYALGVDHYKSTTGGSSWSSIAWNTHVDHHAIWVNPANPQHVIIGNDGGVFISYNGGSSFQKIFDMAITQFYAATVDYNHPERLYGGTQDNGTLRTMTGGINDWEEIYGGDGFYVIVDPTNSNIIYAEYQYGGLGKSTNGGYSFFPATSGINSSDRTNWMTPVVMDPNNHNVLYYGTYRVYKTTNAAGYWTPISGDLSNGPYQGTLNFGTITTIAVAPSNSSVIYAGTDDGNVWVSSNGGSTWSNISATLPQRWVTRVAVHPTDPSTALVTFSGYKFNYYIGHIYRTTDMGQTWEDISANLPEAPINVALFDPDYPYVYYVGTDVGVFFSPDSGNSWQMLGNNLPASVVMDLVFHQPTRTLVAATHGRSMFKMDVSAITSIRENPAPSFSEFQLTRLYPNPFNSTVNIEIQLNRPQPLEVSVFDILGRRVKTLHRGTLPAGKHLLQWDGRSSSGTPVASGQYLVRAQTAAEHLTRKVWLIR